MEIVTAGELAEKFEQLTNTIEDLGLRLTALVGNGKTREYFTRAEAAEYLRMSVRKLDALSASGQIRRAKLGDGVMAGVLFRRVDLDTYVKNCLF